MSESPTPFLSAMSLPAETLAPSPSRVFDVDCELRYELAGPADFLFQVHALDGVDQSVLDESFTAAPERPVHIFEDPNVGHRFARLQAEAGPLCVHYRARVKRTPLARDADAPEMAIAELPDTLLHNLMPTRYCESDLLSRAALKMFGDLPRGYARVQAIADWVHDHIDYQIGTSDATTTACDVFRQRAGVCRDFAHLAVSFCRALNIPARLVVGYASFEEPPPDFHAVFEAWLGGQWISFDPTRLSPVDDLVRIAMGRDAKDVAFATIFGPAAMTSMQPLVSPADPGPEAASGPLPQSRDPALAP